MVDEFVFSPISIVEKIRRQRRLRKESKIRSKVLASVSTDLGSNSRGNIRRPVIVKLKNNTSQKRPF